MKAMQHEWKSSLVNPDWNAKQYYLYLVNVYSSGVCGVLPDKQLIDSQNTVGLTFEFAQFAIRLFYSQLFSLGKQALRDWALHISDIITANKFYDYTLAWVKILYLASQQSHIASYKGNIPQEAKNFINSLFITNYTSKNGITFFDSGSTDSLSGPITSLKVNVIEIWNALANHKELNHLLSQHTIRQLLHWCMGEAPTLQSFTPKLISHGVIVGVISAQSTIGIPTVAFKITSNVNRAKLAVLDKIFPPTSDVDSNHMITRLSALVNAIMKMNWIKIVKEGGESLGYPLNSN